MYKSLARVACVGRRSWESFASASLPDQNRQYVHVHSQRPRYDSDSEQRPRLGSFQPLRWMRRCEWDIGAQSRLLWTGARCAIYSSESTTHLTLHVRRFQKANYQFSHYVAEISNSFSNLFFICISIYGARLSSRESLPARYLVGFAVRLFSSRCSLFSHCTVFADLNFFLRCSVGVCFSRTGKHSFPRDAPL